VTAALFLLVASTAFAQALSPAFEVTSVKPDKLSARPFQPGDTSRRSELECSPGGRFVSHGNLLIRPVMFAWNVPGFQVSGLPGWAQYGSPDAYFEIEGRSESPVSVDRCRLMVQALFADRFKLKVHHETKEIVVYALVLARGGQKLKEGNEGGTGARMNGRPMLIAPDGARTPLGWSTGYLADALSLTTQQVDGRRVVDRTGLKGVYQFNLIFDEFPNVAGNRPHDQPDVFVAVQEQLGLKLEERKEPFDIIVVDHMEKPSEN
jgi:uncharacterized protein (TIGR03435 family)